MDRFTLENVMPSRDLERLMWAQACEMLERAERLQRQFFRPGHRAQATSWEPPVDVYEVRDGLWLVVAMPGADGESIDVRVDDGDLVVRAERQLPAAARNGSVHRLEIPYGRFQRRVSLPPGTYALQEREWRDGCLFLGLRFAG
ncbi:Hsp20/alpha crystallin family protein [Aquisalimonas sp.]|uniref:Hsp20/alpha crystallin family protein n=1 Tax=Aquisalimonas sp. TaxID=1872621 RepID=UPI0025B7DF03|nr:Hsp20/alpha crystallin family protein [Aquisalimonas sp.]